MCIRDRQELLALVKEKQPDVVVTDIKMPVMDGIEAVKKISELYPEDVYKRQKYK